jgi:hypothetical protein
MSINCALHAEGLQNPFHVKWMHINIYLYVAIFTYMFILHTLQFLVLKLEPLRFFLLAC